MLIFDKKRETFQIVGYKQFDSSEPLKVKFLNNGRPIDLSQYYIRLECKKPDGTIVVDDENITIKNVCELEMYLNEQVTVVSGKVKCQLVLVSKTNEKQSTTFTFIMDIQQSVIGINGYSQSVITIAERLNKDVIKAESLHKNLTDDITVGTPLQANLRKDINEGKPLSEQLGKDIATGTVLNVNLGRNIVDGNKTNEDLTVSLESAKGSVELIKGTGNENKIITSTLWTLNSDGHYEHTWTHNLNSTNIIIAMFDNDTKESLNYTYQVVDKDKIKILSDVQKNVKVVLNVQYYSGGMGIKDEFKEAKDEIEEARGKNQFLVDRLDTVDYKLNTVSSSLEQNIQYKDSLYQQTNNIRFVAHRGSSHVAPENTIPSYQIAGKSGFWGAECDILPTVDGTWVLMHDDKIDRMTNGVGNVIDLTLAQIKSFNIDGGSNVGMYPNLKVPTLEEFLITCKNHNLVPYIEIKGNTSSTNYDNLINTIRKYGFEAKSVIISAYPNALIEIRNRTPHIHLQYITNVIYPTSLSDTKLLGNSSIGVEYTIATKSLIDEIHSNGMKIGVWTVNDYSIARNLIKDGVDFLTSDSIVNVRWE